MTLILTLGVLTGQIHDCIDGTGRICFKIFKRMLLRTRCPFGFLRPSPAVYPWGAFLQLQARASAATTTPPWLRPSAGLALAMVRWVPQAGGPSCEPLTLVLNTDLKGEECLCPGGQEEKVEKPPAPTGVTHPASLQECVCAGPRGSAFPGPLCATLTGHSPNSGSDGLL